ncbi:hypothetical protein G6F56_003077 [Rhizopus delemar]|nr:hypothetical protein G6F56_003077 [Rhizopus delemar]
MPDHYRPTRNSSSSVTSSNIVGVHYKVGRKIGEGSFGIIYEGINLINNQQVAIKFESRKSDAPQLRDEYRTYKVLAGLPGIPGAYYFGQEGLHSILVIDLLGPSLEDLFDMCSRKFSIKTVAMLAKQMITRIQSIHERNLIYRDIKPDNFLIGHPNTIHANTIYLIDFGMGKLYRDPKTKHHVPYREKKSLSGTARYMSINTHLGREQSRRDDLESLGHVFMYFLRGSLPWQGLKAATNKQKYERIGEKKQTTTVHDLCAGFPEEFGHYLQYARRLAFEENPNYDYMMSLFDKVLESIDEVDDGIYDWMLLNDGKGWEVVEGFLGAIFKKQWHRVAMTRAIALVPSMLVAIYAVDRFDTMGEFLNVLQSLCLPAAIIPILKLTASSKIMSTAFKNSTMVNIVAWLISFIVVGFNIRLFLNYLDDLDWPAYAVIFSLIYFIFVAYLMYIPLEIPNDTKEIEVPENDET